MLIGIKGFQLFGGTVTGNIDLSGFVATGQDGLAPPLRLVAGSVGGNIIGSNIQEMISSSFKEIQPGITPH